MRRDCVEICEPAFADLLHATSVVELYGEERILRLEIGGRIVEGEMTIFADAYKCDINRRSSDGAAGFSDHFGRIPAAIQQVVIADTGYRDQVLLQEFAEACGMSHRETDVLVQVEEFDLIPGNARHRSESG